MPRGNRQLHRFQDELGSAAVSFLFSETLEAQKLDAARTRSALEATRRGCLSSAQDAWNSGLSSEVRRALSDQEARTLSSPTADAAYKAFLADIRGEIESWPESGPPQSPPQSEGRPWIRPVAGISVVVAILVAGFLLMRPSSDSDSSDPVVEKTIASVTESPSPPVTGSPNAGEVGTMVLQVQFADGVSGDYLLDWLDDELSPLDGASPARWTGPLIEAEVAGVTRAEYEAFELPPLPPSGPVTLHPVITCEEALPPDVSLGQESLPGLGSENDCVVGPAQATGEVFAEGSVEATLDPNSGWGVQADLRDGEGTDTWNNLANQCFNRTPTCPSQQLALVLDGTIYSAPTMNSPNFTDSVQVSGTFTEDEARLLADALNRGASPVPVEVQQFSKTFVADSESDQAEGE